MAGWIKLHRKIWEKGWYTKSEYLSLWIHLLLKASHSGNEWVYKGKVESVKIGEFITSRKTLSKETGIKESKVERILKCFEIEQQIEQQNNYVSRKITILNYDRYQMGEQVNGQQVNSKWTASEQQVNTIKNDKKDKKDKNDKNKDKSITPLRVEFEHLKPSVKGIIHHYEATTGNKVTIEELPIVENMLKYVFPAQLTTAITVTSEGKYREAFHAEGLGYLEQPVLNGAFGAKKKKDYQPKARRDKYERHTEVFD
jgi:hypothetical protein